MPGPTWYAIYDGATGALRSVGTVVADPLPAGLAALELGAQAPDLGAVEWDTATHAFVPRAAAAPVLSAVDFRERFTFDERVAIRAAARTDDEVAVLMEDVGARDVIHLDDPRTVAGVQLLASKGLIAAERVVEILGNGA